MTGDLASARQAGRVTVGTALFDAITTPFEDGDVTIVTIPEGGAVLPFEIAHIARDPVDPDFDVPALAAAGGAGPSPPTSPAATSCRASR